MVFNIVDFSIEMSRSGEQIVTFIFLIVSAYGLRAMVKDFLKWQRTPTI